MLTQPNLTVDRLAYFGSSIRSAIKQRAPLVIAGGAVRDVLNGRNVKDLDVFIQVPDWSEDPGEALDLIDTVVAAADKLFYERGKSLTSEVIESGGDASDVSYEINSVWHWNHGFNDMPCDFIFIKEEPSKCYDEFDFGICQALVSPLYGLRTTRAYQRDALNKTITYLLGDGESQREKSKIHLSHFLPKYQDWRVRGIATSGFNVER